MPFLTNRTCHLPKVPELTCRLSNARAQAFSIAVRMVLQPDGWIDILKANSPSHTRLPEARLLSRSGLASYSREIEDTWHQRDLKLGACAVVGGLGFVGQHVVHYLLSVRQPDGAAVRVLDVAPADGSVEFEGRDSVDLHATSRDLDDLPTLISALSGVSTVFFCTDLVDTRSGGAHRRRLFRTNVEGLASLLAACRVAGVQRLVFLSSAHACSDGVWGDAQAALHGRGRASPYGLSKRAGELLVHHANTPSFQTITVRAHTVFGPGDALGTERTLTHPRAFLPPFVCVDAGASAAGAAAGGVTAIYVKNLAALLVTSAAALAKATTTGSLGASNGWRPLSPTSSGSSSDGADETGSSGSGGGGGGGKMEQLAAFARRRIKDGPVKALWPTAFGEEQGSSSRELSKRAFTSSGSHDLMSSNNVCKTPSRRAREPPPDPYQQLYGGEILDAGDLHCSAAQLRQLILSCRAGGGSGGAAGGGSGGGTDGPTPLSQFLDIFLPLPVPLWLAFVCACCIEVLDRALCLIFGPCDLACLTALTRASLYYSSGAPFRFRVDAYARAGMAAGPPFASLEAILQDLAAWTSAFKQRELNEPTRRRTERRWQRMWLSVLFVAFTASASALHPGFTFEVISEVSAPRSNAWRHVLDMGRWHEWHGTFRIDIDGLPSPGKPLRITCRWPDGAFDYAPERITYVEDETALCWDYEGLPDWLLGTERCIVLSSVMGGANGKSVIATRIHNYEVFFGPLAPLIALFRGRKIQRAFEDFNADLHCKLAPRACAAAGGSPGPFADAGPGAATHSKQSATFDRESGGVGGSGREAPSSVGGKLEHLLETMRSEHRSVVEHTASVLRAQQQEALASLEQAHGEQMRELQEEVKRQRRLEAKAKMPLAAAADMQSHVRGRGSGSGSSRTSKSRWTWSVERERW